VDLLRRRGYAPLAAAFTPWGPKQGNIQSQSNTITPGRTVEYDEDVTATEAAKADGGTEGVRLVTIGELDAHREESPELSVSRRGEKMRNAMSRPQSILV